MVLLYFLTSICASTLGALCGIGGGVIIKPVLDLFQASSVSAISFLSGCTVLTMAVYSIFRDYSVHKGQKDNKTVIILAVGAAIGGIIGQALFQFIKQLSSNSNAVGAIQSLVLLLLTLSALCYIRNKSKIATKQISNKWGCIAIGLTLGTLSSFLGIGGGPFNLIFLSYFFSMDTKAAARGSLFIILLGQLTSLLSTLIARAVPPDLDFRLLYVMVIGGLLGGMIGRKFNQKLKSSSIDKLFSGAMVMIILIAGYSTYCYIV